MFKTNEYKNKVIPIQSGMAMHIRNDSTGRLRQENCHEFEASLSNTLSQKTKKELMPKIHRDLTTR